ncbi:MAG: hypothetical protein ABEI99_00015, partial [Halobaculum sp.]
GATDTALVSYFEPVVAALVAAAALGHAVTLPTVAGFAVVLSGFAVVRRQSIRHAVGTVSERVGGSNDPA